MEIDKDIDEMQRMIEGNCRGCGQDVLGGTLGVWTCVFPCIGFEIDDFGNLHKQYARVDRKELPYHCVRCANELTRCREIEGRVTYEQENIRGWK
jgi:hypothetical protein